MAAIPFHREVEYPYSDGQPMAESDLHRDEMVYLIEALKLRYQDRPDVYVAGNLFLYYEQGNPRSVVAPDVFLVQGVPNHRRPIYKLWEEGHAPRLAIEVTSSSTRHEDLSKKKNTYERLGIEEYFLHDPTGDYLSPRLQGFRLVNGRYESLRAHLDGSLESRTVGLRLNVDGETLRLIDATTGERLPDFQEMAAARQAAEERAEAAEARVRALEEELTRLRGERKT
jgi:Uma2 family endonuclease